MNNLRITLVCLLAIVLRVSCGGDYFIKMFCHPKFWDFTKCVKKEGGNEVKEVMEECSQKLVPDGNEKVFYRSLCNDTHNRDMFLRCNYEEIAKHGAFVLPTKCMKIVQPNPTDSGKKVQSYLCDDVDRLKCFTKHAPYEDLKIMDICQRKLFPEVTRKEFQTFVCEMKDGFDLKRLADYKTCWGNKLKEAGRPVPPRYAIEKGAIIKWWLCDKKTRYKCIKDNLPVNMTLEVDQCMHEFFPKVTDDDLSSICDVDGDEVEEKIGRVTGCAIHAFKLKNPGMARVFITKC